MPDKRSVDELSIEELERILAIRKREARQKQLRRMEKSGRKVGVEPVKAAPVSVNGYADSSGLPAVTIEAQGRIVDTVPEFDEGIDPLHYAPRKRGENRAWKRFTSIGLLLVEVAAVVGLLVLGFGMIQNIDMLQRETAQVQASAEEQIRAALPTIEPTPTIQLANVVLPGGHTPPIEGRSEFNWDEVPTNLHAQVYSQVYLPPDIARSPVTEQTPRRIVIPDLGVDHVIVQGVDWEALKLGVGQLPNGITPDDPLGNVVLAAHNDIYGEIFRYLDQLQPGMSFEIFTATQRYRYEVTETQIVDPDAVQVMESQGRAMATLISCYPYQVNTQRIVVFADLVQS